MEIVVAGEVLADQFGADDRAVLVDQAAVGLVRKERLAMPVMAERIDKAGDGRHGDDHDEGGTKLLAAWGCP